MEAYVIVHRPHVNGNVMKEKQFTHKVPIHKNHAIHWFRMYIPSHLCEWEGDYMTIKCHSARHMSQVITFLGIHTSMMAHIM